MMLSAQSLVRRLHAERIVRVSNRVNLADINHSSRAKRGAGARQVAVGPQAQQRRDALVLPERVMSLQIKKKKKIKKLKQQT